LFNVGDLVELKENISVFHIRRGAGIIIEIKGQYAHIFWSDGNYSWKAKNLLYLLSSSNSGHTVGESG